MNKAYRDFIRFSLDNSLPLPDSCGNIEWQDFYKFCLCHSIHGVVFEGLERADVRPSQSILLEWIGSVEFIKRQNFIVNKRLLAVTQWWNDNGHRSVILKGQANGLMYPKPQVRCPGDIDIWVEGDKIEVIKSVLKHFPKAHYSIHHIKMPAFEDVSVEVHYRPIYLTNWFVDKRLQRYINDIQNCQFSHTAILDGCDIGSLTDDFNVIYQLLHMYAHFFSTRNNFKQFIDYYYLLKRGLSIEQKEKILALMKELKVLKYARGIMWVMHEILGLDPSLLVVEPDEKVGKVILKESMKYGSFSTNKMKLVIEHFVANIRLAFVFPSEVLISPLFLIWHQWWKLKTRLTIKHLQ